MPRLLPPFAVLVASLACGSGPEPLPAAQATPSPSPAPVPGPTGSPGVVPRDPWATSRFPQTDDAQAPYWRAWGPSTGPWAEPVEGGTEAGWAWFRYDSADVAGMREAWLAQRPEEIRYKRPDGSEAWLDLGSTRAGIRTNLVNGKATIWLRAWFAKWPDEWPTDPFCAAPLRPVFRYDGETVIGRGCVSFPKGDEAGPFESTVEDVTIEGERDGYLPAGHWRISTEGRVLAEGDYKAGKPHGEWRHGDRVVQWVDGKPQPVALDGVLPDATAIYSSEGASFQILDLNLESGWVAWKLTYRVDLTVYLFDRVTPADNSPTPCRYPGLAAGEGVELGLTDLRTRTTTFWTVYKSAGEPDCTPHEQAAELLAAAKAAWAEKGLDSSRKPPVVTDLNGLFDLGEGHQLAVEMTWDPPPLADQYSVHLLRGVPYDDGTETKMFFARYRYDGAEAFLSSFMAQNYCQGGSLAVTGALRQGARAVAIYEAADPGCEGDRRSVGFTPIFGDSPP
jgi:hypothetical protein